MTTLNAAAGASQEIREMLLFVVRCLVDHPDQVQVVLLSGPDSSIFWIHAHPADVAKLMGNGSRIAKALQCIVGASGRKLGLRLTLDIVQEASRLQ
jgi:predicted RNA-binding protein YlqC (UPF0109 family)